MALEGGSSVIAGVFIGLYYSWELTLLIFGFTPLLVIAIKITMKMTGGHAAQGSDALEEAGKVYSPIFVDPAKLRECLHWQ